MKSQKRLKNKNQKDFLLEKLAELEHVQWIEWSKELAKKKKLSKERLKNWSKLWKPYKFLPEKTKEQDRVYARKTLLLLKRINQGTKTNSSRKKF